MNQIIPRHYGRGRNLFNHFALYLLWIAAFAAMTIGQAQASTKPDFDNFSAWPVLHEGRVKTMESFARSVFYQISGDTHHDGINATEWMAVSLFEPSASISMPVIEVKKNPTLGIDKKTHISMNAAMELLSPHQDMLMVLDAKDPATLSAPQKDMLKTYQAVSLYNQIIQSFSAVLPLQGHDKSFIDGGGSDAQRALITEGGKGNNLLKFVANDNPSLPLISLWQSVLEGVDTVTINDIQSMARAWIDGDYSVWNDLSLKIKNDLQSQTDTSWQFDLEHYYVTIQPMIWVMAFYVMGAILMGWHKTQFLSLPILSIGFIVHVIALLSRSLIMMRPPTGTLYETLLFGACIIMMMGLIIRHNKMFLAVCGASAAFLLFVSRGFIQGDSLNVLVAVLNTNFWLSTHVTCIIIGYAFCVMAAMVGHVYLFNNNIKIEKLMMPMTLAALLFTSVGTLLGGIWADQSWGRFWGWDPKENGALLIVLWLAWVLHGRVSGHFQKRGFAAALGLTNIMVALTWFGVNLLGVGLHSYGFISGIAWGLGSFIALQTTIITWLYFHHKKVTHG